MLNEGVSNILEAKIWVFFLFAEEVCASFENKLLAKW
jgi:hypothetical protein